MIKYYLSETKLIRKIENDEVYVFNKVNKTWHRSVFTPKHAIQKGKELTEIDLILYNLEGIKNDKN